MFIESDYDGSVFLSLYKARVNKTGTFFNLLAANYVLAVSAVSFFPTHIPTKPASFLGLVRSLF